MHSKVYAHTSLPGARWGQSSVPFTILLTLLFVVFLFLFMTLTAQAAQAQTYRVLYNFTGGADQGTPAAGLSADLTGNLYGTTCGIPCPGNNSQKVGTVFKLSKRDGVWVYTTLYVFHGGSDGATPAARVIFGPDGALYGTTAFGGTTGARCFDPPTCGTVFKLTPTASSVSPSVFGGWTETVLYRFSGDDGYFPDAELTFDPMGNILGTTRDGGAAGTVFKLMPTNGGWTLTVILYLNQSEGGLPSSSVLVDAAGNLYATASYGADQLCDPDHNGCGIVFELLPSGSGWSQNILHTFHDAYAGAFPQTGLISDEFGNLYGTTSAWETETGASVFKLTSNGAFSTLYTFGPGVGPEGNLVMDAAGNLYGTTYTAGAYGYGSVFKLTHSGSQWLYTSLHDFTGDDDGGMPISNVIFGSHGELYGTASIGGAHGYGAVWEITSN